MRIARVIVAAVALSAASVAAAQEDSGLHLAAMAGGLFGQGPMMFGAQTGAAFEVAHSRIEIRYLAQYYGTGSYALPQSGGCLGTCPSVAATNQLLGASVGAKFNVLPTQYAPYLLASVGFYQSRFLVNTAAIIGDPGLPATHQQFLASGFGGGAGIGMNIDVGGARLYGEVQLMYMTVDRGTNAPTFVVPVTVGIGF
jgi:hypothetical protein